MDKTRATSVALKSTGQWRRPTALRMSCPKQISARNSALSVVRTTIPLPYADHIKTTVYM